MKYSLSETLIIGGVGIIGGGGVDIVIIINNRGVGIIGGWEWMGLKNKVDGFLVLYVKLSATLFYFFSTNRYIFPLIQEN